MEILKHHFLSCALTSHKLTIQGHVFYFDIISFLQNDKIKSKFKIYIASLDGKNVYNINLDNNVIIVFGNESKGVSKAILDLNFQKITIPQINYNGPDSLNIVSAYSVIISRWHSV